MGKTDLQETLLRNEELGAAGRHRGCPTWCGRVAKRPLQCLVSHPPALLTRGVHSAEAGRAGCLPFPGLWARYLTHLSSLGNRQVL